MYTIKPNPNSQYMQVKPQAQKKALERNGTRFVTLTYKGKKYNGVVVKIDQRRNNALVRLATDTPSFRTLKLDNVTRINAQGLIMEY